jgi:hypothetical protein
MDPVLLAIGRNAFGDCGGRLEWLDADLRSPWSVGREGGVDAAVSTTALHWLQPSALAALYRQLATALRTGGVFANGDRMEFPHDLPRLAAAAQAMRDREQPPPDGGGESWEEWWSAVEADPGLAEAVAERSHRHHDHPHDDNAVDLEGHVESLRRAGFAEVGTIWQHQADRVLVAIR